MNDFGFVPMASESSAVVVVTNAGVTRSTTQAEGSGHGASRFLSVVLSPGAKYHRSCITRFSVAGGILACTERMGGQREGGGPSRSSVSSSTVK